MNYLIFLLLFLPLIVQSQSLNAGFVQGVWYSTTPFFAGETVRIYTAIQNNSGADIEGKVVFVVNGQEVGQQAFSAVNGRIVEAWTDWQTTEGTHAVSTQITEALRKEVGKDAEPITLESFVAPADEVFVDRDTDGDGIGNARDEDDDNDGFTDQEELTDGTDPLDSNSFAQLPPIIEEELEDEIPSPVTEFVKRITDEYLGVGDVVDKKVAETIADFQAQRETLAGKKTTESLTTTEIATDWFLASAIAALPEWRFGLFALFGLSLAFLARRLGNH